MSFKMHEYSHFDHMWCCHLVQCGVKRQMGVFCGQTWRRRKKKKHESEAFEEKAEVSWPAQATSLSFPQAQLPQHKGSNQWKTCWHETEGLSWRFTKTDLWKHRSPRQRSWMFSLLSLPIFHRDSSVRPIARISNIFPTDAIKGNV